MLSDNVTSSAHLDETSFPEWSIEKYIGKYLFIYENARNSMGFTSFTIERHSTLKAGYPYFIILWTNDKKIWRVLLKYSVLPEEPKYIAPEEKQYMEELWEKDLVKNFIIRVKFEQDLMVIPSLIPLQIY